MQLCGRIFKKMPPIPFCPHPAPKSLYKGESLCAMKLKVQFKEQGNPSFTVIGPSSFYHFPLRWDSKKRTFLRSGWQGGMGVCHLGPDYKQMRKFWQFSVREGCRKSKWKFKMAKFPDIFSPHFFVGPLPRVRPRNGILALVLFHLGLSS